MSRTGADWTRINGTFSRVKLNNRLKLGHIARTGESVWIPNLYSESASPAPLELDHFVRSLESAWRNGEVRGPYKKRRSDAKPHTWRTRPDPYEEVWPLLQQWLNAEPHATAKGLFRRLYTQMPNRFKPAQYRTLQRRVKEWRTAIARRLVLGCNYDVDAEAEDRGIEAERSTEELAQNGRIQSASSPGCRRSPRVCAPLRW